MKRITLYLILFAILLFSLTGTSAVTAQQPPATPNRLIAGSIVVTSPALVKSIYTHILTLKPLKSKPHAVCPTYVRQEYDLTFLRKDNKPALLARVYVGGCSKVLLSTGPPRAIDPTLLKLLKDAGIARVSQIITAFGGGYRPVDLQDAYDLPSFTAGQGQTIAIIDAYNNPYAESDLAVYRASFGLPLCDSANGCFRKVNQSGGQKFPQPDSGWAGEIALDLDMVSAICPLCRILLVEASSDSMTDLGKSVDTAVRLGAQIVSNSYGGSEDANSYKLAHYYGHAGVTITASAGDSGYGVQVPAAYNTVIAVGGTSLTRAQNARGWQEVAWPGTGSGCSQFVSKPLWQNDPGCARRTTVDVAAVADPQTGVAVYDTYGGIGWATYGGTSVSAPIVAGVYALAGNATTTTPEWLYKHYADLNGVVSGSNGECGGSYLCTAGPGYNGPTGYGTPNGTGAF
jgi:subtilase family serine protease